MTTPRRTEVLTVSPDRPDQGALHRAGAVLRAGGLVAFPTETVYGLGADALDEAAVRGIFAAKGRPGDNPLIVHVASEEEVAQVAASDGAGVDMLRRLARRWWPGPLTVILPKGPEVPDAVTAGLATVAVRMPDHPVALGLIRAAGRPVAAPSANRSGRPSPTEARHVLQDLDGRIDMILDGGPATIGVESTVLDLSVRPAVVHRPGAITMEQLRSVLGDAVAPLQVAEKYEGTEAPPSPGIKYEHYAPRTPCVLVEGFGEETTAAFLEALREERRAGRRTGVLCTEEGAVLFGPEADAVCVVGARDDFRAIAHNLYRCLRRLDEERTDIIYVEGVESVGLGSAIMNRLRRAAGGRILTAR